ncbi:proactivator polypeptide-like 1 [Dasypus novemcinctus]|uniref:proactivator polypeptide-like 1 n=1 Tax=Dasypus novemcinctus TaxID=9361 RepID=UPI0039C9164C
MRWLLLLLLWGLLGAAAGLAPASGDCTPGSAARCRDLRAAARCGNVRHCRAVWARPATRSLACHLCQRAAATGHEWDPEATGAAVLASVRRTCAWLRGPEAAAGCRGTVDAHGAALLGMLGRDTGSGPREACTALTLCRPLQGHLVALGLPSPGDATGEVVPLATDGRLSFRPASPAGCQDCVRRVTRLQEAARSSPFLVAMSLWEQCAPLGPGLALLCKSSLRRLSVPAEAMRTPILPEDICRQGGFCQQQRGTAPRAADGVPSLELAWPGARQVPMEAGLTCELCLSVVQQLDEWLASNRTEAVILHALEHACAFLPSSVAQRCVILVDTYSPSLVQLVIQITPEKVCTAIRLCGPHRRRARSLPPPEPQPVPRPEPQENQGSLCNSCMNLLQESSHQLEKMSAKRDILTVLRGGCRLLPLAYRMRCNQFVTNYNTALLESLRSLVDPVTMCKRVGACHAPRKPLPGTD